MSDLKISYSSGRGKIRARATVTLVNQTKKRFDVYAETKEEAKQKILNNVQEANDALRYGIQKNDGNILLKDAVLELIKKRREEYNRTLGREMRRNTTCSRDEDCLKSLILPHKIASKKLNQIFVPDLEEYMSWLQNRKYNKSRSKKPEQSKQTYYSASTLNRTIRLVKTVIDDYYVHSEQKSPACVLKFEKTHVKKKTVEDFLVGDEILMFLRKMEQVREESKYDMDSVYADIMIFTLVTACRPGEARGLKRRDYNEKTKELKIIRTGSYDDDRTKTEDSKRRIYLTAEAIEILDRRCKNLKPDDYIFQNSNGNPVDPSDGNDKLKRWLKEIGIKKNVYWHKLRGSGACFALDNGISLADMALMMGHANSSTTATYYICETDKRKQDAANHLSGKFAFTDKKDKEDTKR